MIICWLKSKRGEEMKKQNNIKCLLFLLLVFIMILSGCNKEKENHLSITITPDAQSVKTYTLYKDGTKLGDAITTKANVQIINLLFLILLPLQLAHNI